MMPRHRSSIVIVLCCTLAVAAAHYFSLAPLANTEHRMRDVISRHGRVAAADPRLVFMAVDNDSVTIDDGTDIGELFDLKGAEENSVRALSLMSKGWPWSRETYALMLDRLIGAGASAVVFDLTFPTPTGNDPKFQAALERYRAKVVLGCNFVSATTRGNMTSAASISMPVETLIPATTPLDDRVGFVNFWPDTDDVIRSAQYRVTFEQVNGDFSPSLDSERYPSLAARAVEKAGRASAVSVDLDARTIRYAGPAQTFAPHSVFEIFVPEYWERNYQDGHFFRDKIVVIGAYGNWQHDEHRTPFGTMPGPEVQINAINALLRGEFLRELPPAADLGLLALAGLLSFFFTIRFRTPALRIVAAVGLNAFWVGASFALYNHAQLFLLTIAPLCLINLNGLCALFHDILTERREKKRVRLTLERYVSRNVVRELLDNRDYVNSLGGAIKPVTILFSDIRNFSVMSARLDPQTMVAQLNEYLTAMVDCVFAYNGTLDKFIGDAVMAVWGNAHTDGPQTDACNALRAASAMRDRLKQLNEKWAAENRPQLEIGVALNHGSVVTGNIGSAQRMEYTVIGDAVNTSWRLQEFTKIFREELLFGESVAELVGADHPVRKVGERALPGTGLKIGVFTLAATPHPTLSPAPAAPVLEPCLA